MIVLTIIDVYDAIFKIFEFFLVLSRKGQSTSSLRRHLRLVHDKKEFEEKRPTTNEQMVNRLSPEQKQKLHQLAVNAIIEDGRSFNDFNKPGITKLFKGLLDGMLQILFRMSIIVAFRFSTTASKYSKKKYQTFKYSTHEKNGDTAE